MGAKCQALVHTKNQKIHSRQAHSSALGSIAIPFDPASETVNSISIFPRCGAWTMVLENPQHRDVIVCPQRPSARVLQWKSEFFGQSSTLPQEIQKVRIGVIDWGFKPSGSLQHVLAINEFGTPIDFGNYQPINDHGRHVCELICGTLQGTGHGGVASDYPTTLVAIDAIHPPDIAVIPQAIDTLVDKGETDIINISGGFDFDPNDPPGDDFEDLLISIENAINSGVLVVAAVGNIPKAPVAYPARYSEVLGVSSVGKRHLAPKNSFAGLLEVNGGAIQYSNSKQISKDFFTSPMCCAGPEVNVFGPGVAIEITDPDGAIADYQGTSFASPLVAGFLANLLARDQKYCSSVGASRVIRARQVLDSASEWAMAIGLGYNARMPKYDKFVTNIEKIV